MESERATLNYASPNRDPDNSQRIPRAVLMGFLGAVGGVVVAIATLGIFGSFGLLPRGPAEMDDAVMYLEVLAAFGAVGLVWGVVSGAMQDTRRRKPLGISFPAPCPQCGGNNFTVLRAAFSRCWDGGTRGRFHVTCTSCGTRLEGYARKPWKTATEGDHQGTPGNKTAPEDERFGQ